MINGLADRRYWPDPVTVKNFSFALNATMDTIRDYVRSNNRLFAAFFLSRGRAGDKSTLIDSIETCIAFSNSPLSEFGS